MPYFQAFSQFRIVSIWVLRCSLVSVGIFLILCALYEDCYIWQEINFKVVAIKLGIRKTAQTAPSSLLIIFPLSFYQFSHTLFGETSAFAKCIGFFQIVWGFCQIVSLLPNCIRFCQMISLTPNCIRLSPNRSYFLAKDPPPNRSSPTPECKNAPKNTRK